MVINGFTRRGFTLIELLVVMALMAVMAGFAILFFPNAASSAREARAATNLQGWLNIAKQRAMRDQAPRGLRLWVTSTTVNGVTIPNVVTDCQYIEQPDDLTGGPLLSGNLLSIPLKPWQPTISYPPLSNVSYNGVIYFCRQPSFGQNPSTSPTIWVPNYAVANFSGPDFTNGYGVAADPLGTIPPVNNPLIDTGIKYWSVQPGDYIELLGTGTMHRIQAITPNIVSPFTPASFPNRLIITPPVPNEIVTATTNFRILRAPRPIGDELLKMPSDTVIDLNPNLGQVDTNALVVAAPVAPNLTSFNPNPLPPIVNVANESGFVDILFAPNGSVISRGVATKNIHLWVRVPHQEVPANVFRGDPTLVSVFVRTGLVGAYPPARTGDPYALVK